MRVDQLHGKKRFLIGKNKIHLSEEELATLALLVKHRELTLDMMYDYLSTTWEIKKESYRQKVRKYIKYGLVVPRKMLANKFFNYLSYRIGKKGFDILVEEGYVTEVNISSQLYKFNERINLEHHLAALELVCYTLAEAKKENKEIESYSSYDVRDSILFSDKKGERVFPDWAFLVNDKSVISLEMDMATMTLTQIRDKLLTYASCARDNSSHQYYVLISIVDDTCNFSLNVYSKHERRVANMKQIWFGSEELPDNLILFVVRYSRSKQLLTDLVFSKKPTSNLHAQINTEAVAEFFTNKENFEYTFTEIPMGNILKSIPYPELHPPQFFKASNSANSLESYVCFMFMEEGNSRHLQRLEFFEEKAREKDTILPLDKILAIYPNEDELLNDDRGIEFKHVLFGDGPSLSTPTDVEPVFLRSSSPLKMEETTYEGI